MDKNFLKIIAFRISRYNTNANRYLITPLIKRNLLLKGELSVVREKLIQFIITNKSDIKIDEIVSDINEQCIKTNSFYEILDKISEEK